MKNNRFYFKEIQVGYAVGYHCEGGETFEMANSSPLSLDTLHDDRWLFMGRDTEEWVPRHLNLKDYRLYKIVFKFPERIMEFNKFTDYHSLFYWDDKVKNYCPTEKLLNFINAGYHLFILGENDMGELTESFLVFPTRYVQAIDEIQF